MRKPIVKKVFILAAGFGSRLKPLTDNLPKALIPYKGKPMIENVITKLTSQGINEIVINTHHHADRMNEYFSSRRGKEDITLVYESRILGTGGALKNAEKYLVDAENFFIYNTDVDSDVDLEEFSNFHLENEGIATLCVQQRKTTRYLISDSFGKLTGRTENGKNVFYTENTNDINLRAFCGIHLINRRIFQFLPENEENFDIIPLYMSIINQKNMIFTYDISSNFWKDLGVPQNL